MTATDATSIQVVERFMDSLNRRDTDAAMADMTSDCAFEHVAPPNKGIGRFEGEDAVRKLWDSLPQAFPEYRFEVNNVFASGDRCSSLWTMTFQHPDEGSTSLRGADVFIFRDGKILEKLTYFTM
jgi:taurine dehydrogenase small subunit